MALNSATPFFLDITSPGFSTRSQIVYAAREHEWHARTPYGLAILRHREVGLLLRDKRLRQGSYAWPDVNGLQGSFADFWKRSVISQEGEKHRLLRSVAVSALSEDFIVGVKPHFDDISDNLVAAFRKTNHCEFMSDFSTPFAGQAICAVLGLPLEQWSSVAHDASALGLAMGVDCKSHEPVFNGACERLMKLAEKLVARVRGGFTPSSYVARLVQAYEEAGLNDEQALLDLIVISIFGGVDTTRAQLGFAMALFSEHPDQWTLFRENPGLVANVVEETIRAWPTTTWATREAIEDFNFQGLTIAKGTTLHMLVHASARDPTICDNPAFDITAKRKIHFGFGGGAHHCIGHLVARTDMASALIALSKILRTFWIEGEARYLPDSGNTSPITLPLRYEMSD